MTIGATLQTARIRAGLTIAALSEATRVQPRIVAALEHDDFAACRGELYARGHLRTVASHCSWTPGRCCAPTTISNQVPAVLQRRYSSQLLRATPPALADRVQQHRLTRRAHHAAG